MVLVLWPVMLFSRFYRHYGGGEPPVAVSVSTDMWTPINVKAYLTITSHFINDDKLMTILLVVEHFFQNKVLAHFHQGSVELSKEKNRCLAQSLSH